MRTFRHDVYACFTRRRDALFELVDALLTGETAPSPAHHRGWCNFYAALAHGRLDVPALRTL